jgi:hypothetical protein
MQSYAQNGEDIFVLELIKWILKHPNPKSRLIACEFGAHDGKSNSNLRLISESGIPLIFIEANKKRFSKLVKAISGTNISAYLEFVGTNNNTLGDILLKNKINPSEVKVLSIDVDGDDLAIFESIYWEIDICVIEYNPTIPFDTKFINPLGKNFGNSALSIIESARLKNLFPCRITETNIILLNKKYSKKYHEINLENVDLNHQLRFALAYDGSVILTNRNGKNFTKEILPLGWTKTPWVQPIPKYLRKFNKFESAKIIFGVLQVILRPDSWLEILKYLRRRIGKGING